MHAIARLLVAGVSAIFIAVQAQAMSVGEAMDLARNGKPDDAIREIRAIIAQNPAADNIEARLSIGLIYFKTGQYDNALAEFSAVASLRHDNPMAYYFMGMIYEQKALGLPNGDARAMKQKALDAWQNYLSTSENTPPNAPERHRHIGVSKADSIKSAKKHIEVLREELAHDKN